MSGPAWLDGKKNVGKYFFRSGCRMRPSHAWNFNFGDPKLTSLLIFWSGCSMVYLSREPRQAFIRSLSERGIAAALWSNFKNELRFCGAMWATPSAFERSPPNA